MSSLTWIPSRRNIRSAGLPPVACAIWPRSCACREVRRANGAATDGSRSEKVFRPHFEFEQRHRHTLSSTQTAWPCAGKSSTRRRLHPCLRPEGDPQSGQMPLGASVPDTTHPPASVRPTCWTNTSLAGAQCFLEITTTPPDLSGLRIVAPHKLRMTRFKGNATVANIAGCPILVQVLRKLRNRPVHRVGETHHHPLSSPCQRSRRGPASPATEHPHWQPDLRGRHIHGRYG